MAVPVAAITISADGDPEPLSTRHPQPAQATARAGVGSDIASMSRPPTGTSTRWRARQSRLTTPAPRSASWVSRPLRVTLRPRRRW